MKRIKLKPETKFFSAEKLDLGNNKQQYRIDIAFNRLKEAYYNEILKAVNECEQYNCFSVLFEKSEILKKPKTYDLYYDGNTLKGFSILGFMVFISFNIDWNSLKDNQDKYPELIKDLS